MRRFGVPCVVAVNRRAGDADEDLRLLCALGLEAGAHAAVVCDAFEQGGAGAAELAEAVVEACELPSAFQLLYEDTASLTEKLETVARRVYGADGVDIAPAAARRIAALEDEGFGGLPVCIAKTPLSLSADPALIGAPEGFTLPVRDVRVYAGAGWVVALCGDVQLMPGLPDGPVAELIDIDGSGATVGLF